MFKVTKLVVLSFLLLGGHLIADEVNEQISNEEMIQEDIVIPENAPIQDSDSDILQEAENIEPEMSPEDEISQAQREADEAEAAELREVGVGEEPLVE